MVEKKDVLIIISLFFISFLIRIVNLSNVCIQWDEYLYWFRVFEILANDWAPTAEVFEGPSPFLSYIRAAITLLFDGDLNTLRAISVIFGSLTVPSLYLFGKAMYGRMTGLLSASFLCFSAYHCFYSRLIMLEAPTLFFIVTFLYFFWLSQCSEQQKSTKYAIIAGAMMGLAITAKYLPFTLVPAILIYVFWTGSFSFKALMDKRIILTLLFALIVFFPLLMCLFTVGSNPVYFHIIEKYEGGGSIERVEKGIGSGVPSLAISIDELFRMGMDRITEILAWGAKMLIPPWTVLFEISVILLFLISLCSYLPGFINREKKDSFLMISILTLYTFLLFVSSTKYYLIYSFPIYFVMLSHLAVKSFEDIRTIREKSYKNIFRIFILLLVAITLLSSFVTAVTSPYWDEGESSAWIGSATGFIKNDIDKNGYEGDILIGLAIQLPSKVDYTIYRSNLNASTVRIIKIERGYGERVSIDLEMIKKLKPSYLIVSDGQYDIMFKNEVKKKIFKDYKIVFHSNTHYHYNGLVLKRKNIQQLELATLSGGEVGKVTQDVFDKSVPGIMKVGKTYTALVQVKNTGDLRKDFSVNVYSEGYSIFIEKPFRGITLDKNSTRMLKFKIVPVTEYVGELPIMVNLYAQYKNGTYKKVDFVSDYVYLIKK